MKNKIKYLVTLLNVPTEDNEIIIKDMVAELSRLRDDISFIDYCKENFANHKFLNGYQKFLTLIDEYTELENEAWFQEQIKADLLDFRVTAKIICDKVVKHKNELIKGEQNVFTTEEIRLLPCLTKDVILYTNYIDTLFLTLIENYKNELRNKFVKKENPKKLTFKFQKDGLKIKNVEE